MSIIDNLNNPENPMNIPTDGRNGATSYVAENASSYKLDYFPIQGNVTFEQGDCQIYGNYLEICLGNSDGDLFAGASCILAH